MGRERWTTRLTVESCLWLDIESFRRAGTVPSSRLGISGELVWETPSGDFLGRLDYVTQTTLETRCHQTARLRIACRFAVFEVETSHSRERGMHRSGWATSARQADSPGFFVSRLPKSRSNRAISNRGIYLL